MRNSTQQLETMRTANPLPTRDSGLERCSSVLRICPYKAGVGGSSPSTPTIQIIRLYLMFHASRSRSVSPWLFR